MENSQNPQVSPEQVNGVWLSREEYERLRSAAPQVQVPMQPQPVMPLQVVDQKAASNMKDFWTYAGGAAALLVFVGLSSDAGAFMTVPMTIAVIVFAILAIKSLVAPSKKALSSVTPGFSGWVKPKKTNPAAIIVLGIIGLIIFLPMAPMILFILFMFIMAATGQDVRGT